LGYVWVINHRGEPVEVLHAPKEDGALTNISLTNLALGGLNRQTIYCTDSLKGRILMGRMSAQY
jgi:gluconolactonase